jgi:hypothetical protein
MLQETRFARERSEPSLNARSPADIERIRCLTIRALTISTKSFLSPDNGPLILAFSLKPFEAAQAKHIAVCNGNSPWVPEAKGRVYIYMYICISRSVTATPQGTRSQRQDMLYAVFQELKNSRIFFFSFFLLLPQLQLQPLESLCDCIPMSS